MALQVAITQAPFTAGGFRSAAPRTIVNDQVLTFNALASDDGGGEFVNPDQVTEQDVYAVTGPTVASSLPIVNRSIFAWFDRAKYQINPWLICSGKQVRRIEQQKFAFRVQCDYSTHGRFEISESDLSMIDIPANVDAYPYLQETVWDSDEKEIYEEAVTGGKQKMRLPTGNLWAEPFVQRYPRRIIRQMQFETHASSDDVNNVIRDRLYTLQDAAFMGDLKPSADPNGTPWPVWWITDIQYQPVDLLAPGAQPEDAPTIVANTYLMTYTIERTNRAGGWLDRRALIDNVFINSQGKKEAIRDETDQSVIIWGLLDTDGTLLADQDGEPIYLNFRTQPNAAGWATFLKGAT